MNIEKLQLYTNKLEAQRRFCTEVLGLKELCFSDSSFTVQVGWSELTFHTSNSPHGYHYCFLIPSNKLEEALSWMEKRMEIFKIEGDRKIQFFESWNARSFYFIDPSGNLGECIARYDLNNESNSDFDRNSLLCVNEIGCPTQDVQKMSTDLNDLLGTQNWRGDLERFGTVGTQEGLFLVPNYSIKKEWFPSNQPIIPEPFEIEVTHSQIETHLQFKNGEIIHTTPSKP